MSRNVPTNTRRYPHTQNVTLDADDVWLPNKLADQVALFQQYPGIGMVAEASEYWYSWEDAHKEDTIVLVGAPGGRAYEPTELLHLLYPLVPTPAPCPSGQTYAFLISVLFSVLITLSSAERYVVVVLMSILCQACGPMKF